MNQVIAVGALLAALFAGASALFAALSVRAAGQAIRAQTFLAILNTARDIGFSRCMDTVRSLPDYDDFDAFEKNEEIETQRDVRIVVDFLNDVMHLIRHGYIGPVHILSIYTPSIEVCDKKLVKWWLEGFRRKNRSDLYYQHFKFLCENVQRLKRGESVDWSPLAG